MNDTPAPRRTVPASPANGAALRHRLAADLAAAGVLRSPRWRAAVEAVPREVFVREWFERRDTDRGTLWAPVTGDRADPERVYADTTLVTQLDGRLTPGDVPEPVYGSPSSSSTLPGLVVGMLEDLQVREGDAVLEVGTGSGYCAALLAQRLGGQQVTTVEIDEGSAGRAAAALDEAGFHPHVVVGDGLDGVPERAPFDRVIATCSVRHIPRPWLDQARPGAVVLATLTGWLYGFGLVRLSVRDRDHATGAFLPGQVSFMQARRHAPPPVDAGRAWSASGAGRPTALGPDVLADRTGRFVVQGALPTVQHTRGRVGDGPFLDHLVAADGSFATLLPPAGDGGWRVRQGGPTALWDVAEEAVGAWRAAGSPGVEAFVFRVVAGVQSVALPGTALSWSLPR